MSPYNVKVFHSARPLWGLGRVIMSQWILETLFIYDVSSWVAGDLYGELCHQQDEVHGDGGVDHIISGMSALVFIFFITLCILLQNVYILLQNV